MNIREIEAIGQHVISLPHDHPVNHVDEAGGLFPPSRYYLFFRLLAALAKPRVSVVLGVCGGGDCHHLCIGNPDGRVVGVDIVRDHPEQMEFLEKTHPGFTLHIGDSVESARPVFDAFGPINFLFIDTTHTKDATVLEFEAWKPYLVTGAIVCFDDLFRTEMAGVWEGIPEPKVRMDALHDGSPDVGGGFGVHVFTPAQGEPDCELGN